MAAGAKRSELMGNSELSGDQENSDWSLQGLINVPFWEYWTSPYSSHKKDHIPNGWVMFNGDMTNDPCTTHNYPSVGNER